MIKPHMKRVPWGLAPGVPLFRKTYAWECRLGRLVSVSPSMKLAYEGLLEQVAEIERERHQEARNEALRRILLEPGSGLFRG